MLNNCSDICCKKWTWPLTLVHVLMTFPNPSLHSFLMDDALPWEITVGLLTLISCADAAEFSIISEHLCRVSRRHSIFGYQIRWKMCLYCLKKWNYFLFLLLLKICTFPEQHKKSFHRKIQLRSHLNMVSSKQVMWLQSLWSST